MSYRFRTLQIAPDGDLGPFGSYGYELAREHAARIAAEADATIAQLVEALELARDYMHAHVMGLHEAYRGYPHRHARDDADLAKVDAAIKAAKGEA